jgi:phosphatidylglycerophosphate synthase
MGRPYDDRVTRPAGPTIAELRAVTQPPAVRGRKNSEHWVADVYLRRLSPYLTRVLLRGGFSANAVTWIMIVTGASAGGVLLIPGLAGALLAVALGQLQMLWDCCDGEVARWRATFSPAGVFLDKVGHYVTESAIPLCLGIRAAGGIDGLGADGPGWWGWLGGVLAVLVLLNKALNDMVHVARAFAGLPRLEDVAGVGRPTSSGLARVRSLARFVPFHRIFHSVEMTILVALAAVVDLAVGDLGGTKVLLAAACGAAVVTVAGHVVAILSSTKLRPAT